MATGLVRNSNPDISQSEENMNKTVAEKKMVSTPIGNKKQRYKKKRGYVVASVQPKEFVKRVPQGKFPVTFDKKTRAAFMLAMAPLKDKEST
jgi:hypothetical protein